MANARGLFGTRRGRGESPRVCLGQGEHRRNQAIDPGEVRTDEARLAPAGLPGLRLADVRSFFGKSTPLLRAPFTPPSAG